MKLKLFIVCITLVMTSSVFSQTNPSNASNVTVTTKVDTVAIEEYPFIIVEQMPQFKGGEKKMFEFIQKNSLFPILKKCKAKTMVIVDFIVEKDGLITNGHVVRSISPDLDNEAIRLINSMPAWEPGRQGGHPVRVKITLPIYFK